MTFISCTQKENSMTTLGRLKTIWVLVLSVLVLTATSCSQKNTTAPQQTAQTEQPAAPAKNNPVTAEQIARAHGLDSFGQIEAIRYTFNAQFPGVNVARSWIWEPKTGKVSYEGKDKDGKPVKATYVRTQLNSQPANVKDEVDPSFVNDNYWLLFPFHAYWDKSAAVTDQGIKQLPDRSGSA